MTLEGRVTAMLLLVRAQQPSQTFLVLLLLAIALAPGSGCAVISDVAAGDRPSATRTSTDAERIAKDCHTQVSYLLTSPGSAKFVEDTESATEHFFPANGSEGREVDHHAVVTMGSVDSQNTYGGLLRTSFFCFTVTEAEGSLLEGRPIVSEAGVGISDVLAMERQLDQNKADGGW